MRGFVNDTITSDCRQHSSKSSSKISYFCVSFSADSMFLATISEFTIPITDREPIVWDSAPINPGGHFNTILGMYTAPVHGYYQ